VAAETLVWELVDCGLAQVHERRTRRGEWEAYQWTLMALGLDRARQDDTPPPDVDGYLTQTDPKDHPVLSSIREWLSAGVSPNEIDTRLVMAIGEELRAGRVPRGRLLSIVVGGHTKAVRLDEHREALEAAFGGFALEDVIRMHGRAVLAYGDFRFRIGSHAIDGRWSVPWLALTPETLRDMEELHVGACRIRTVENLVAFEEEARRGVPTDTILVYTGGFPSTLERTFLTRLVERGVDHVEHWGDLDVGGLRILRHLAAILPCPVRPWRMEPELLGRLPGRPLTPRDRDALAAWVADPEAPLRDLAEAILACGVKVEQEGWFLSASGGR